MADPETPDITAQPPSNLMSLKEVQAFFGGGTPVSHDTIYRWMREGRIPKSVRMGPQLVRWLRSECQEALDAMIAARDDT